MVRVGDDQQGKSSSLGEKRSLDVLARLLHVYVDEETRARLRKEEQERNMFMIDTRTSTAPTKPFLGKRKNDICENQQNPSDLHDYASSSSSSSLSFVESKRRRGVSNEPIRAVPIREVKPLVRDIKPQVRERNRPVRRKKPVKKEPVRMEPEVIPEWVVDLVREKNGVEEAKLIIKKAITSSDLKRDQGRLLMPFNQMADMNFLNAAELYNMEEYVHKSRKKGVDVIMVDSVGKHWDLNLRTWGMKTSSNYVLCTGWNSVVLHYDLQEDQIIRLWSFHSQDGKLYFAFPCLPPAPAPGIEQPQAQDPTQAVALPQAQDATQAMALALTPAIATASSSSMVLVVTRDSDEICVETPSRCCTNPEEMSTPRVCVPAPTRDSSDLRQSILEGLDLYRPLPEVCTEMALLEAVQETDRSTSLESVTETSLETVTETTTLESDTETTTLDLELRL